MTEQPNPASLFSGELNLEEIDRLLDLAESDPLVSSELDLVCDLHAGAQGLELDGTAPEFAGPVASDAQVDSEDSVAPQRSPLRILKPVLWLTGLAAACLVAWLSLGDAREMPAQGSVATVAGDRTPPAYVQLELRAPETDLAAQFRTAMRGYADGDWSRAVRALTEFLASTPDHGPALFYRAAAHEALGEIESASEGYRNCANRASPSVAEHALWRLAQLEWSRGALLKTRAVLEELLRSGGPFEPSARALLAELDG